MAGVSGISPQRRITKLVDLDGTGEAFLTVSLRETPCLWQESTKTDFARQDSESRQSCVRRLFSVLLVLAAILLVISSSIIAGPEIWLGKANFLGRQCATVKLRRPAQASIVRQHLSFAMVTCSDGSNTNPQRSFEGLMELVSTNKKSYVERYGYDFIDASDVLDRQRPPSWSKILAVSKHLPQYDWVFWNDVDSLVTNPSISLEDIIDSTVGDVEEADLPDFILTKDVTGVNAGMFFVRNSEWSKLFLDKWWNQTSFIQPPGLSKSGDNDALKYLVRTMPDEERRQHVRIPSMQCLFNSNLWRPSWRSRYRLLTMARSVWQGVYSEGDFMVHLAGLNNKKKWMKKVLHDIAEEQTRSKLKHRKAGIEGEGSYMLGAS